jgi:YegS/Rv2252/BmrU family lipid kinase
MTVQRKKIRFIINPISGVGRKPIIEKAINDNIDRDNFEHEIVYTKAANHATELSREAAENNYDIVVAVGGDGSVNEVAKGIIGTNTSLGIIPAGSGNGLAHHLKISSNPAKAVKIINETNSILIDTVKINDETFISIAGIGFDALVAKKYAKEGKRGFWSYFKIVTREYINYKPKKYSLNIDGNLYERNALLISFANSSQFGYHASIAPYAELSDGFVDVCICKKVPLIEAPLIANLLYLKQIDKTKYIEIIKAKNVTILRKRNKIVNLDGEPVKLNKTLNINVIPKSLRIIIP